MNAVRFTLVRLERIVQNAFVLFEQGFEYPTYVLRPVFFGNHVAERERADFLSEFELVRQYRPWQRRSRQSVGLMNHYRQ